VEILDFDAFLPPSTRKVIKVDGETHGMYDLFDLSRTDLNLISTFEERSGKMTDAEALEEMKGHILRLVPSVTRERIDEWPLRKLGAFFEFVIREAAPAAASDPLAQTPDA
jgi:hypothetical protein